MQYVRLILYLNKQQIPQYAAVENLAPKRHDKTTYSKLYTARVTKRLFDMLKDRENKIQEEQQEPAEKFHPFGQSGNQMA